ncbi:hypothetical protein [Bradyrhizobium elkanii]|uniref:hypothetical protein n=1 Tax=Bradyrhizobium elkanii TaxID=29448 RepID=UPI0015C3B7D5|nr:hypothetical protein [Bradyrhizobium elkanii]NWL42599.1 hypothetical protein [Bradyrhizobium elkanii]
MNRITIIRADGGVYEVHALPRNVCPILYADGLVRRYGEGNFRYQIEASGQKPKAFTAIEIKAHAALKREFGGATAT